MWSTLLIILCVFFLALFNLVSVVVVSFQFAYIFGNHSCGFKITTKLSTPKNMCIYALALSLSNTHKRWGSFFACWRKKTKAGSILPHASHINSGCITFEREQTKEHMCEWVVGGYVIIKTNHFSTSLSKWEKLLLKVFRFGGKHNFF